MSLTLEQARHLVNRLESLRAPRMARWREIGRLILPSRGLFPGEEPEGLRESNLFNPAAGRALRKAAAGMTQAVTPAGNPWFRHAFVRREDRDLPGAGEYADAVDALLNEVLNAGGFYPAIHAFNKELLAFGCALLVCAEHPATAARFRCLTCGTWSVATDISGRPEAVACRVSPTLREAAERFGVRALSPAAQERLERAPFDRLHLVHLTCRRTERDPDRLDRRNMPFASYWYEAEGATDFLDTGGFRSMPFFFAVWEEARGIYGAGPGDEALADQKGIEAWELRKALGVEKMIDPPLLASGPLKTLVDAAPGAVIPASGLGTSESLRPLYEINFGPAVRQVGEEIERIGLRLDEVMGASIFAGMSLEARPAGMSMTEYMDRRRRAAELMGPTLSGYEPRVLTPLLERVFELLDAAGLLPEPPQGLSDLPVLGASYQSPMARMLDQTGAVAIQQLFELLLPMLKVAPDMAAKIDFSRAVDELARRLGVPASVIRADAAPPETPLRSALSADPPTPPEQGHENF